MSSHVRFATLQRPRDVLKAVIAKKQFPKPPSTPPSAKPSHEPTKGLKNDHR